MHFCKLFFDLFFMYIVFICRLIGSIGNQFYIGSIHSLLFTPYPPASFHKVCSIRRANV